MIRTNSYGTPEVTQMSVVTPPKTKGDSGLRVKRVKLYNSAGNPTAACQSMLKVFQAAVGANIQPDTTYIYVDLGGVPKSTDMCPEYVLRMRLPGGFILDSKPFVGGEVNVPKGTPSIDFTHVRLPASTRVGGQKRGREDDSSLDDDVSIESLPTRQRTMDSLDFCASPPEPMQAQYEPLTSEYGTTPPPGAPMPYPPDVALVGAAMASPELQLDDPQVDYIREEESPRSASPCSSDTSLMSPGAFFSEE